MCEIEREVCDIAGVFVDRKTFGFTVDYRTANKEGKALIRRAFQIIIAENPDHRGLSVLRGKQILELTPDAAWDKGKAALFILGKQERQCLPIYVGDDLTDETAFKALTGQGVTVRIGKSEKRCTRLSEGEREVLRFLQYVNTLME